MIPKKKILIGLIFALLAALCSCSAPEGSEIETMQVDPIILSIIEDQKNEQTEEIISVVESDTSVYSVETVTEQDVFTEQDTMVEQDAVAVQQALNVTPEVASSEEHVETIRSYYDANTAENTDYDGWILTLYRFDRSWYEETQSVPSGSWPIWQYGVTHYPYARDEGSIYMLSLPLEADTDTKNDSALSSYKAQQEDTLSDLKDYAKTNGLTLNPDLDEDYATFISQLWKNTQRIAESSQPVDRLQEKLNGAAVEGNVPQAARDAFYDYLSANRSLFDKVARWNWSLTEDTKSKYISGWISLSFDGTNGTPGGYSGTSLYYRPDTGAVLTFEETDAYVASMDTGVINAPAISGKLQTAFSSLGSYNQNAFDAMVTFLGTPEGGWMWEKCRDWSWTCSYDSSTDQYTLECVGPQEADGTRGAQYLVARDSQIVSYPSGYIAAAQPSDTAEDTAAPLPTSDPTQTESDVN